MSEKESIPLLHSSFPLPTSPVLANSSLSSNQSGEGDIRRVLKPGRYVGAKEVEDAGDPSIQKRPRLVAELHAQFAEFAKLEQQIKTNLDSLGFKL